MKQHLPKLEQAGMLVRVVNNRLPTLLHPQRLPVPLPLRKLPAVAKHVVLAIIEMDQALQH